MLHVPLMHDVSPPRELTAPRIAGIGIADADRDRPWSDEPCVVAAQRALALANCSVDDVDLLILADRSVGHPGHQGAALLARRLGTHHDPAVCEVPTAGTAMHLALAMLDADPFASTVLVVRVHPSPSTTGGACAWVLRQGPGPLSVVARSGADSPVGAPAATVLDTSALLVEDVCSSAGVGVERLSRLVCLSGRRPLHRALRARLGLLAAESPGTASGGLSLTAEDGGELIQGELILLLTVENGAADAFLLRV